MQYSRSHNEILPSEFTLTRMLEPEAREVAAWQYAGEYAVYNGDAAYYDKTVRSFLNPEFAYHVVWHDELGLTGFCCYGADAQVPGGDYSEDAVDIGLGLRPDLVGRGIGPPFLLAVMCHATYSAGAGAKEDELVFRATIADFNGRSLRLFARAGFVPEQKFVISWQAKADEQHGFVVVVRRPVGVRGQLSGSA
jgi:ribosomal-protein-alanine N-acetyltransferase